MLEPKIIKAENKHLLYLQHLEQISSDCISRGTSFLFPHSLVWKSRKHDCLSSFAHMK